MSSLPYNAPTFFSTSYFAPVGSPPVATFDPSTGYRDSDAFAAIVSALEATGEFAAVTLADNFARCGAGAPSPLASVNPVGWEEFDETDPTTLVRRVDFVVALQVREDDFSAAFKEIDRLASIVQDALDGSNLGGGCLPGLTLVRRGRFDREARHPEMRLQLAGEFSYLVANQSNHNVS